MTVFNFIIIYYKKVKNLIDNLSRRPDFKDDNKLSTTKYQPLLNFLFKFQEYLRDTKNNPIEKQNIDFNKTFLFENVLNLIEVPQDINSIRVLLIKSESQDECSDSISNSIDYNQIRIFYLELTSIIKKSNNQAKKAQFVFVIGVINREPYIL